GLGLLAMLEIDRARALFDAAIALPREGREAWIREECRTDEALREMVLGILAEVEAAVTGELGEGRTSAADEGGAAGSRAGRYVTAGSTVGPYKIIRELGVGGFGTVFLAEQTKPVKRMVAIKVIRPGMHSPQVLTRFEAERQALAVMNHPNVAKVFDAGATE